MSESKEKSDLSREVQKCHYKTEALEKEVEELKNRLRNHLQEDRRNSFKKWETLVNFVGALIVAVLGAVIFKILP